MGIFAIVLAAVWVLKALFEPQIRRASPGLAFLMDLLTLLLAIPAVYYVLKLSRGLRSRLLWKIRRRIILTHIFIGAIPVLLVIVIFLFSALLFYYQLSYYLITNQIGIHAAQIQAFTMALREGLHEMMMQRTPPSRAAMKAAVDEDAKYLLGAYPSASIVLSFPDRSGDRLVTYVNQSAGAAMPEEYSIPRWVTEREEFTGLVIDDTLPDPRQAKLLIRSFVSSDFEPNLRFNIEVSVPFDRYLLNRLKAVLGQDFLLAQRVDQAGLVLPNEGMLRENVIETTYELESETPGGSLWPMPLFPYLWTSGMDTNSTSSNVLLVELSTSKLMQNLFRPESTVGTRILGALQTIVIFFVLAEVLSLVIGILLTKSITTAVHNLDRGTQFVKRGDFSHRVVVRSQDQLGALAASFNQMTEYVQDLVKERVQKERLERELEIAKEVQEQMFPERAPEMGVLELAGVCLPARVVSGDYYDFLPMGSRELGLAVGDICGKGISAALLMTNLQATLRSTVMNLRSRNGTGDDRTVSELVESLNRQICSYTSANKFATFFYALYNDERQTLTYCNAGHNPPLFFKNGKVRRLDAGGTVVGIFEDSKYEQETIELGGGDVLVAYTDGITESVNEYGEEFGEERLIRIVQENRDASAEKIKDSIVKHVLSWTFAEEREDDMTLIVARIRGR